MRAVWEKLRSTPGIGGNVLAVLLVAIGGLVAAGFLLPKYDLSLPWTDEYEFRAVVQKAPGMRPDAKHPVAIAGIQVGTVRDVVTRPDGNAEIRMALDEGHVVHRDARLQVRTLSPLNDVVVALEPGSPAAGELPTGEAIGLAQTSRFIQPDEVLGKLDARTQQAVTSLVTQADLALRDAPRTLPAGLDATDGALTTLRPVVDALEQRRVVIRELVGDLAVIGDAVGTNDERLAGLVDALQTTLGTLAEREGDLDATLGQLPGLTTDLDRAMTSTVALADELDPTLDSVRAAADELPGAIAGLRDTAVRAGPVVDAARPVVDRARPVVADLRVLTPVLRGGLGDLVAVTGLLPDATEQLVPWLPNLQAFVYHTSSAFSVADANGGLGRAQVTFDITNPAGGLAPMPTQQNPADDDQAGEGG